MKRSKNSRVSWPSGPKLCQVKMFRTEDCPAKVASQTQGHNYTKQSSNKSHVPDLPPGFEGNHYAAKLNVSTIPRIRWKRPPRFLVSDTWLMGDGGESTAKRTENLRISKVLEAVYPHRSTIPSRPSVSSLVETESFDDNKTPAIPLKGIDEESESSKESMNKVSSLAPDLTLAASAALAALMKTNEQGSMVDPQLLIKLLKDPEVIKNLITVTSGNSSETKNQPIETNNVNPTRLAQQHVPMTNPHPTIIPASQPFTSHEQRRVSPPKPLSMPMPVQSCVSMPKPPPLPPRLPSRSLPMNIKQPSLPARLPPSSLPMNFKQPSLPARVPPSSLPMNANLQRPPHVFSQVPKVIMNPQPQQHYNVHPSNGFGRGPQTGFTTYPPNLNRIDVTSRPKPVVQPMKSEDYFKNLIREHGTVNHETNQYHSQTGKFNGMVNQNKFQKQCIYYGTAGGCQMGDRCQYVHGHLRPNFEAEAPMAKRMKFGRYEGNGFGT